VLFRSRDLNPEFDVISSSVDGLHDYIPPEVGSEIYIGSVAAMIPIVYATVEFSKRIIIQRGCLVCKGSGLTDTTRLGGKLAKLRKCWSCGGFIPWLGWQRFFLTSIFDVGNGGVLQRPAADYDKINEKLRQMTNEESVPKDETDK